MDLGITDAKRLVKTLKEHRDEPSKFVWRSMTDEARDAFNSTKGKNEEYTLRKLVPELRRIIQSGDIFTSKRFPKVTDATRRRLQAYVTAYQLAAANRVLFVESFRKCFSPVRDRTLTQIAVEMASNPKSFTINDYPPSSALIYWFVDGIARAGIRLPAKCWSELCEWAAADFNHQRSLVLANHQTMMDPVAMGMAACLCARLRSITDQGKNGGLKLGATEAHLATLPSLAELEHSIMELFKSQNDGVWPKYFPLFHYQDAGSNFCFTFELLEAVLVEFCKEEDGLLRNSEIISGLADAVHWCERNRLKWSSKASEFNGWNSGGNLQTLEKGQPESWATAVVHMFLFELDSLLSRTIQAQLLQRYKARTPGDSKGVASLINIEILERGTASGLKEIIIEEIVTKCSGQNEQTLRRKPLKTARSALLFGPPGTSKTKVTEALADDLEWPLIQIDPSHFLESSLDGVYVQANRVFRDLSDLSGVVVLFDEMDALVQTRDSALKLDTAAQFLTTFMLPKLTELHDRGRIVFLMATNFQERFDAAIKRAGRFDLLLCMGPPKLAEKIKFLHRFLGEKKASDDTKAARKLMRNYAKRNPKTHAQLELYTFGEFSSFVKSLQNGTKIGARLAGMTPDEFADRVERDSRYVGLRLQDLSPLAKLGCACDTYKDILELSLDRRVVEENDIKVTPIIRYLLDRQDSRRQL
jgi:hypothetical protein